MNWNLGLPVIISIHALHEEGDLIKLSLFFCWLSFLSTPSTRRATIRTKSTSHVSCISIHALHEEGDCTFRVYL